MATLWLHYGYTMASVWLPLGNAMASPWIWLGNEGRSLAHSESISPIQVQGQDMAWVSQKKALAHSVFMLTCRKLK